MSNYQYMNGSDVLIEYTQQIGSPNNGFPFLDQVNLVPYADQNWDIGPPNYTSYTEESGTDPDVVIQEVGFNATWVSTEGSSLVAAKRTLGTWYDINKKESQTTTRSVDFKGMSYDFLSGKYYKDATFSNTTKENEHWDEDTGVKDSWQKFASLKWSSVNDISNKTDDISFSVNIVDSELYNSSGNVRLYQHSMSLNYTSSDYSMSYAFTSKNEIDKQQKNTAISKYSFKDINGGFSMSFTGKENIRMVDGEEVRTTQLKNVVIETADYKITTASITTDSSSWELFNPIKASQDHIASTYYSDFEPVLLGLYDPFTKTSSPAVNNVVYLKNPEGTWFDAGDGNDKVTGSSGDDVIVGGTGNDWLIAGAGDDVIRGSKGTDKMTGGAGADIFVFRHNAVDSITGNRVTDFSYWDNIGSKDVFYKPDVITDFKAAEGDRIDLRYVNIQDASPDNIQDTETPIAFSATAKAYSVWYTAGQINIDINNNIVADYVIKLTGVTVALTEADFILG